jgi:hypothetical protein
MTPYDTCNAQHNGDSTLVLECVADWMEAVTNELVNATAAAVAAATATRPSNSILNPEDRYVDADELNSWLLVLAGAMVFFMQVRVRF